METAKTPLVLDHTGLRQMKNGERSSWHSSYYGNTLGNLNPKQRAAPQLDSLARTDDSEAIPYVRPARLAAASLVGDARGHLAGWTGGGFSESAERLEEASAIAANAGSRVGRREG